MSEQVSNVVQYHLCGVDDAIDNKDVPLLAESMVNLLKAEGWHDVDIRDFTSSLLPLLD